jgi:hypothetical protein
MQLEALDLVVERSDTGKSDAKGVNHVNSPLITNVK